MKTCFAGKRTAAFLLAVCMTLSMLPVYAGAQGASPGSGGEILDSGLPPGTDILEGSGAEKQQPATPSDLPRSFMGISGLGGVGPQAIATATARGIVGYAGIQVWLTSGTFAAHGALDHNHWTLTTAGQTVQGISRISDTSIVLALSEAISTGQTFFITSVDPSQFAAGTTPFTTPLAVEIRPSTPVPAAGTAAATAGTREIAVALTSGEFHSTQNKSYWTLGGTTGNSISGVESLDIYNVKITLAGDIGEEDDLTVAVNNLGAFADVSTARFASPLTVEISPAAGVCAINTKEYPSLTAALEDAEDGDTIKLLGNITHKSPVVVTQELTFDLNGFHLLIDTSDQILSTALTVGVGGNVGYNIPGSFTASGGQYGVKAEYGGQASVSGVIVQNYSSIGAYAGGEGSAGSRVTVNGDITTPADGSPFDHAVGASASGENAKVTVNGRIAINGAQTFGVVALLGGKVEVNSASGAAIVMNGDFSRGVSVRNDNASEAVVHGGVNAAGNNTCGVEAEFGQATVGNVAVEGDYSTGAAADDFGRIAVSGNVSAAGEYATGVSADFGEGAGGTLRVTGTVTVTGTNSTGVSCYSRSSNDNKSAVIVDGQVSGSEYLNIDNLERTKDSKDSEDSGGYWIYNGQYGSLVKVGNGAAAPSLPTVTTTLVHPTDVTATGARVRGGVTADGGSEISAFGFVWSLSADPTTANSTIAGMGTAASFTADLSGLVPNQTYYVRAYAINSAGTAYGENRTFTTAASDPLAAPLNLRYLAHDSAVELFWEAPPSSSPISHYEIMRGNDLTKPWTNVGNVTSHMVTGLSNGENHTFNIRAVNAEGSGAHSFLWAMANIPTPPGPPHSLNAYGINGKVRVSWNTPYYNGHREITGYLVSLDDVNWIDAGRNRSHEFTGLTDGATYTFYVRATNEIGAGEAASVQGSPRSVGGGYVGGDSGDGGDAAPTPAPDTWLEQNPSQALADNAKSRNQDYAGTRSAGIYGVRTAAWARLAGLRYRHDTVANGSVQVRLSVNQPEKLLKNILVSGSVKGAQAERVQKLFERWFRNRLRIVHMDHPDPWGQKVWIAAKVDLTGMDTENLFFYSYDSRTNTYRRIENPMYRLDKNGYLHFETELAGDIIISEGPIERQ